MAAVAVITTEGEDPIGVRMSDPYVWWTPERDGHPAHAVFQLAAGVQVYVTDLDAATTLARGFDHVLRSWLAHERRAAMPEEIIDPAEPETTDPAALREELEEVRALAAPPAPEEAA